MPANSASMTTVNEELGSYRSLSTRAVLSFILGLLSILSFAPSWVFLYVFPPAAIVMGLLALRQVKAAPEVWAGLGLAKLGIGLGVVCAAGAATSKYVESHRIGQHGLVFAERFMSKLKEGDIEGAFWLKFPRESRATFLKMKPDDVPGELAQQYAAFYTETALISNALARGEAHVEFETIEQAVAEHATEYAAVVYTYHSAKEEMRILVIAASYAMPDSHDRSWFIREHQIGYQPNTYVGAHEQSGHGHSH